MMTLLWIGIAGAALDLDAWHVLGLQLVGAIGYQIATLIAAAYRYRKAKRQFDEYMTQID